MVIVVWMTEDRGRWYRLFWLWNRCSDRTLSCRCPCLCTFSGTCQFLAAFNGLGSQSSREYILFPREYTFIARLCLRSYCLVFSPHMPFLPMFCSLLVHCSPPISCTQFPAQVAVCRWCGVYVPNDTRLLVRPLRSPYPLPLHSAMQPVCSLVQPQSDCSVVMCRALAPREVRVIS